MWALCQSLSSQAYGVARKTTAWSQITPSDDIKVTSGYGYRLSAVSLHGKLFVAYKSNNSADRLHVWDGTSWRRVGLIAPSAAPAVANTGAGTFVGKRYYRVRFTVQVAGVTVRRSEPSAVTTFTPSGAGLSARVTKPAATSPAEGETHWEIEASIDNANFYRLSTVIVATTTYDDSIAAYTVGYAAGAEDLSEDIGDYTLPHSAEFVLADEDRLLLFGSFEDDDLASSASWTPAGNDPGVGNDERIPIDTTNTLSLDGLEGGRITGAAHPINGFIFVFKQGHIYKMVRTDERSRAYEAICLTKSRGAIRRSVIEGADEAGNPCIYFLDPCVGPCRLGSRGIESCGQDILNTWRTVNLDADLVTHGIYYPANRQVHWWVATNGSTTPNKRLVVHVNAMRPQPDGVRRGWSMWSTGRSNSAYASCLYSDNIEDNDARSFNLVPFIGLTQNGDAGDSQRWKLIQLCDTGSTDAGATYSAYVTSKPFSFGHLLNQIGVRAGALLAKVAAGVSVSVRVVRNYGQENPSTVTVALDAVGSETHVVKKLDNLKGKELRTVQFTLGDFVTPSGLWEINELGIETTEDQKA